MLRRRRVVQLLSALACPATTAFAADGGWNADRLREAEGHAHRIRSSAVLVLHRGQVVFRFGEPGLPVNLYSGRKSVASVLLGMEADAGRLKLDSTLAELGIDDKEPLTAAEQQATVRQLLTARSGVYHPAAYETMSAKVERPRRGSHAPGKHWYYNNWDFNVLAAVYQRAAGVDLFQGLYERLARPLGFEHFVPAEHTSWALESASLYPAYVMQLSASDLARVGRLMAQGGTWNGQRLLSQAWIDESTQPHTVVPPGWSGYGYMWWVPLKAFDFWARAPGSVFFASGNHGQLLWVDRARDIVVVHGTDHRRWLRASPELGQLAPLLERIFAALPAGA